jgi:hypothetical protein
MKKIMQALGLVLLTAGIVFAAAGSDYKSNEKCDSEWAIYQPDADSQQLAIDSPRSAAEHIH